MDGKWRVVNVEPVDKTGETYSILQEAGCELIFGRDSFEHPGDRYSEDELIELCKDADAIIGASRERFTERLIESIPNLRIISKFGSGTDNIDIKTATEKGVIVAHTPVHSNAVAEHTISLLLAAMKKLKEADKKVRKGDWRDEHLKVSLVSGKAVGIIGFGRIGAEIAKRLQGWEVKILIYDPYASPEILAKYGVQRCATLDEMLSQIDILSINAVLTSETRHMINEDALRKLRKTTYIVNTSRGSIIDEKALCKALREGRIAGAALDVLENEPPDLDNELLKLNNVILTPHISSVTPDMLWKLCYTSTENVLAALRGEIPKYVKNPEVIKVWLTRFGKIEE